MTASSRKRKWAGEPIKDKRKGDPAPKLIAAAKPRVFLLTEVVTTITVSRNTTRHPTSVAREQARMVIERRRMENPVRRWKSRYGQNDEDYHSHTTSEFEYGEERKSE